MTIPAISSGNLSYNQPIGFKKPDFSQFRNTPIPSDNIEVLNIKNNYIKWHGRVSGWMKFGNLEIFPNNNGFTFKHKNLMDGKDVSYTTHFDSKTNTIEFIDCDSYFNAVDNISPSNKDIIWKNTEQYTSTTYKVPDATAEEIKKLMEKAMNSKESATRLIKLIFKTELDLQKQKPLAQSSSKYEQETKSAKPYFKSPFYNGYTPLYYQTLIKPINASKTIALQQYAI